MQKRYKVLLVRTVAKVDLALEKIEEQKYESDVK